VSKDVTTQSYQNLNSKNFRKNCRQILQPIYWMVRTEAEFEAEHIPNSINLNVMDTSFRDKITALDKSKTYFVYCHSGGRSSLACSIMASQGYVVYNLAGGISNLKGEVC
jgi:phage shock protein E